MIFIQDIILTILLMLMVFYLETFQDLIDVIDEYRELEQKNCIRL